MGVVIGDRIGLLGGTFDPVHNGHIAKAGEAIDRLGLGEVLFVVAGNPWMKTGAGQAVTPARHRLEMVRRALVGHPSLKCDDREVRRPGPTYTADTLQELVSENARAELFLLVGSDALASLPRWHMPARVLELARLVVLDRPGAGQDPESLASLGEIGPGAAARAKVLDGAPVDISSSELRRMIAKHQSILEWVPPAVAAYIEEHGLYRA